MRDEAVVRLLANRAGVEQDQIRLSSAGRLGVTERLEHALHALGVVLVHLASERGDVVELHCRPRVSRRHPGRGRRPDPHPIKPGSTSSTRAPCPLASASLTCPPWASAIARTIASPRPAPPPDRL